jgi:hypothetical protein
VIYAALALTLGSQVVTALVVRWFLQELRTSHAAALTAHGEYDAARQVQHVDRKKVQEALKAAQGSRSNAAPFSAQNPFGSKLPEGV